ncbi:MAG: hypothetical protein AUJ72_00500 [Candidatus Omnitrophica bacterium CG1_02_46_14]|nr:MAG: hypothetical protein AUJ72_00500 [Candidatus Omnitrophica bacterium CG1_02_46_14]
MTETRLSKPRLFFIFSFFLLILGCLLFRLGFIQIFKASKYLSIAQSQSRSVVDMQPTRGRILDRKGQELALDVRLDSLYAVPRDISNKGQMADRLSSILGIDRNEIYRRLDRDKLFVWIARKISPAKTQAIKKLKSEALGFVKESMRVYPKSEMACQLIGFTDIDNDGLEGIELRYNSFLKGVPGWRLAQRDAKQRELISKELEMVPPVDGYNIHLTIDEVIQALTEKELAETCKKFNALGGSVVVLDPKTGDILAMATMPSYDLNNAKTSNTQNRRNRAITDLYEPGSAFKPVALSGILENKVFGLDEKFNCENGAWAVAGKVLHDHHGYGVMTFRQIIVKSSNIGTVKGAMRLGAARLYKTILDFGFGKRTGILLTGEVSGIVPNPKHWSGSSIINIPIGQGVAITTLQLAMGIGLIANDGWLMKPRIISKIDDEEGRIIQSFEPETVRRALSKETCLQVRSVLEEVVSHGTGKKAVVSGFRAAGKTGTAQKILPDGHYSHDQFFASFVGFVPYDEPKIVIAVSIDEPHPVYYGGDVAAPAFSRIASGILAYWQISQNEVPAEITAEGSKNLERKNKKVSTKKILTQPLDIKPQTGIAGQ